jgi:hypothetical protein
MCVVFMEGCLPKRFQQSLTHLYHTNRYLYTHSFAIYLYHCIDRTVSHNDSSTTFSSSHRFSSLQGASVSTSNPASLPCLATQQSAPSRLAQAHTSLHKLAQACIHVICQHEERPRVADLLGCLDFDCGYAVPDKCFLHIHSPVGYAARDKGASPHPWLAHCRRLLRQQRHPQHPQRQHLDFTVQARLDCLQAPAQQDEWLLCGSGSQ